jgi:hypothetical protein
MAKKLYDESNIRAIAEAIRAKNGKTDTYTTAQMAGAISAITTGGITPTGTKTITENGTHDVANYASAIVNVPSAETSIPNVYVSVTQEDGTSGECWIHRTYYSNGALVAKRENITPAATVSCAVGSYVFIKPPVSTYNLETDGEKTVTYGAHSFVVVKITASTTYIKTTA